MGPIFHLGTVEPWYTSDVKWLQACQLKLGFDTINSAVYCRRTLSQKLETVS